MNLGRAMLALAACCILGGSASAQSGGARRQPPTRATRALWASLELTGPQQAQINAIHKKYLPATRAVRQRASDSTAKIFAREMAEVRTLLTFAQQQKLDSYMNTGNGQLRRRRPVRAVPARIGVPR